MTAVWVSLGAVFGALLRFAVSFGFQRLGLGSSLWKLIGATSIVNGLGCLLIGYFVSANQDSVSFSSPTFLFFVVGFLGSLTTFSTLSLELFRLIQERAWWIALGYGGLSVLLGVGFVILGWELGGKIQS